MPKKKLFFIIGLLIVLAILIFVLSRPLVFCKTHTRIIGGFEEPRDEEGWGETKISPIEIIFSKELTFFNVRWMS
ncbi:MAG: hypothetical protein KJ858_03885 [Nanoarchaeota archaeon]|nr:hypothetical protein [Nanoarchaeota archaeon]